jgi:hypothetical protein
MTGRVFSSGGPLLQSVDVEEYRLQLEVVRVKEEQRTKPPISFSEWRINVFL